MRSSSCVLLLIILVSSVGCTSTMQVEPAESNPQHLGIPYILMDPIYTVTTGPAPDKPNKPAYNVAVSYRPNPTKQFMIRPDPAWMKEVDFSVSIGTGGQLTSAGMSTREKLTPTVTNLGEFVGTAVKIAAMAAGDTSSVISEMEERMQNRPTILDSLTRKERERTPEETYVWKALLERIRTNAGSPPSQERLLQTFYAMTPTEVLLLETVRHHTMTPCPNPAAAWLCEHYWTNDDPNDSKEDRDLHRKMRLSTQALVSGLINLPQNEWRRRHAVCLEDHLRTLRGAVQKPTIVPESLLGVRPTETAPFSLLFPFLCGQIDAQLLHDLAAVPADPSKPDEIARQRTVRQDLIRSWFPREVANRVTVYERALAYTIGAISEYRTLRQLEGILIMPIGSPGGAPDLDAYQAADKAAEELRERMMKKRQAFAPPPIETTETTTAEARLYATTKAVDAAHDELNSHKDLKDLAEGSFVLVVQRRKNP